MSLRWRKEREKEKKKTFIGVSGSSLSVYRVVVPTPPPPKPPPPPHSGASSTHATILPPDALYGTVDKSRKINPDHLFNDSKERLRPDLLPSRSGSPNQPLDGRPINNDLRPTYNDLCFPKSSNCGSMKRKRNQGVDCQLSSSTYGYINYLNSDKTANFVSNKIYE